MKSLRWWRHRREEELEAEVQSHFEMAARDRMERGKTAELNRSDQVEFPKGPGKWTATKK